MIGKIWHFNNQCVHDQEPFKEHVTLFVFFFFFIRTSNFGAEAERS